MAGPVLTLLAKLSVRRELLNEGFSRAQVRRGVDACDEEMIETVMARKGLTVPAEFADESDRPILDLLTKFFASDFWKELKPIIMEIIKAWLLSL